MNQASTEPKLFMILLGSKAPERNVEQHDFFFTIGTSLKELVPKMKAFWPGTLNSLHVDGWREVHHVDGHAIKVVARASDETPNQKQLFFINLGGYQWGKLEEQHYTVLTIQPDRAQAILQAKRTVFFKNNTIKGAASHVDDKYGIDVDDVYQIEDILTAEEKENYRITITPEDGLHEDPVHLGYFKMSEIR